VLQENLRNAKGDALEDIKNKLRAIQDVNLKDFGIDPDKL